MLHFADINMYRCIASHCMTSAKHRMLDTGSTLCAVNIRTTVYINGEVLTSFGLASKKYFIAEAVAGL